MANAPTKLYQRYAQGASPAGSVESAYPMLVLQLLALIDASPTSDDPVTDCLNQLTSAAGSSHDLAVRDMAARLNYLRG